MEIRVFKTVQDVSTNKSVFVARVETSNNLLFPYEYTVQSFKAIYGSDCVIMFVVL